MAKTSGLEFEISMAKIEDASMQQRMVRTVWMIQLVWLLPLTGCSYANQQLNDGSIPLEKRALNHTRAETFTAVEPPQSVQSTDSAMERQFKPTTAHADEMASQLDDKDGYFVGLALSGGGSRSANFSAACMFQLERIGMLQKVDYISSVSGGSLAAAYYCLNHQGWNPKDAQEKLTHPFANDMLLDILMPWNSLAIIFSDYDRSDLLAKSLRKHLFSQHGKQQTYADLLPDRPRLLINATDLQSGGSFVFCNDTFDKLNSDLAKYPIAYAVAASSSVPVLLHQVTLRDFSTEFKQYHHLIDGGVSDNLGLNTLVETFHAQEEAAIAHQLPDPYPHGAVFIVIDARVEYDQNISSQSDTGLVESVTSAVGLTTHSMLNRASSATLHDIVLKNAPDTSTGKEIRDAINELDQNGFVDLKNVGGHRIRVAHIGLTQLQGLSQLPFHSFIDAVNSTSTYFNIDPAQAAQLYVAADLLMRNRFEPKLREILTEMNSPTTEPSSRNPQSQITNPKQ